MWKSVNGGTTFKPVFDKPDVQSIGAVTIDPTNPKIIWVGTGESWVRNSVSVGDGVYKSTDGGDNWTNIGLKDSEHIAKILVDPKNGNIVYACAPPGICGTTTTSAASTRPPTAAKRGTRFWRASNGSTGCAMMSNEPRRSRIRFMRRCGTSAAKAGRSGQAVTGSGIFKSTDGGDHWTELTDAQRQGIAGKTVWPHCDRRRALESARSCTP